MAAKPWSLATSFNFPIGESTNLYDRLIRGTFRCSEASPKRGRCISPPRAHAVHIDFGMALQLLFQSVVRCRECVIIMKAAHRDVLRSPSPNPWNRKQDLAQFFRWDHRLPLERSV